MRIRLTAAILVCVASFLAPGARAQTMPDPASMRGHYERVTVHGPSLVGNLAGDSPDRKVSVYLPPGYSKKPRTRFPVLYLLHGFTDSDSNWFGLHGPHFIYAPRALDRAYAAGATEMIVVMPDAYTKYLGSLYSSSVTIGDWEAFVTQDLVSYIDAHYRTLPQRASRGLAGHSMGGYGAIRLAMKYPQVFSSIYAMNPCCLAANLQPDPEVMARAAKISSDREISDADFITKAMLASAAAWSPNPGNPPRYFDLPIVDGRLVPDTIAKWAANAPLAMLPQYAANLRQLKAIAIDAADKDMPSIPDTVRMLDRVLSDYGIAHTTELYEGDHVNRVEERLEKKVLPFFSQHLRN
jgi:pimeloyl-ACP methyl ester carboxylesterase